MINRFRDFQEFRVERHATRLDIRALCPRSALVRWLSRVASGMVVKGGEGDAVSELPGCLRLSEVWSCQVDVSGRNPLFFHLVAA